MSVRVLIAGAGLGGLTLAHGLRNSGVDVAVFERDGPHVDPATGYRIHIDATGSQAIHSCVPPQLWARFIEQSGAPPRGIAFVDEHLRQLAFVPDADPMREPIAHGHPISRAGLRRLLLTGLEDVVAFGKRLVRYEQTDDGQVRAHFEDGSSATGDVLVGADGSASAVRKQLLPHARVIDTGVAGIAGQLPLTNRTRDRLPAELLRQMTMVLPARGLGMFTASFQRPMRPPGDVDLPDHLFWTIVGRPRDIGLTDKARRQPAAELRQLALERAERWHPLLAWVIGQTDPSTVVGVSLHTAAPVAAWATSRVTLLGDAIHTMPPLQGLGGNTALRDAALLRDQLVDVDRGQAEVLAAIHAYETFMLQYGFEAVRGSLQVAESVASTNMVARMAFRCVLRLADRLPALHRLVFQRPAAVLVHEAH